MDQNDKKSMEYKLGSFLGKLRGGDNQARRSIFYGILLLGVVCLIYQPTIKSHYKTGLVYGRQWSFIWSKERSFYTDWGTLILIEIAIVSLAFIFLGITKKN